MAAWGGPEAVRVVLNSKHTNSRPPGPRNEDLFLTDFGGYLTYLGGIGIRKVLWQQFFRRKKVGTYFAHFDTLFRAKLGRAAHYLPRPAIEMRLHFQTWVARHFEIWNIYYPKVVWELEVYSDEAKSRVIPRYPLKSLGRILASRAYGKFSISIYIKILLPAPNSNLFVKLVGLLIVLVPREIFRLLYIFYIKLIKREHTTSFSPRLALAQLER